MPAKPPEHDNDSDASTARSHVRLRLREVLCLVALAILLGVAVGYLIAAGTGMDIAARVLVSDMIVGLPGAWLAFVVLRRLARIDRALAVQLDAELAGYNRGYMDCLRDRNHH